MPNINRTPNLHIPLTLNSPLTQLPPLTQLSPQRPQNGNYRPSQTDGASDELIEGKLIAFVFTLSYKLFYSDKWSEAQQVDRLIASKLEKSSKSVCIIA